MILKGNQRGNAANLAAHLMNAQDNEHVELHELRGFMNEDDLHEALKEAEEAVQRVLGGEESSIKLTPQKPYVRRLQHILGQRYNVSSISHGRDPARAVMFYKP